MAGSHSINHKVYNGVSTEDEPSAKWGWHNIGSKPVQIYGWCAVVLLLLLNIGNHQGHVETIFLIALAVVIVLLLVLGMLKPKLSQVRTVTAHNKPLGYEEPEWPYLQATLQGPYAELSDSQLRSLNIEPSRVAQLRSLPEA